MTCFLEPFTYAMDVGNHNGDVLVDVVVVSGCGVVVVIGILVLYPVEFML